MKNILLYSIALSVSVMLGLIVLQPAPGPESAAELSASAAECYIDCDLSIYAESCSIDDCFD